MIILGQILQYTNFKIIATIQKIYGGNNDAR